MPAAVPGAYTLRAHVPADRAVADSERPVAVDGPVAGIMFKTARVRVSGRVACVGAVCDPRVYFKDTKPHVQAKVDGMWLLPSFARAVALTHAFVCS